MNKQELTANLLKLNTANLNWIIKDKHLYCKMQFKNYSSSIKFIKIMLPIIEQLNHHPKYCFDYKDFEILLRTGDCDAITELDFKLAIIMQDKILEINDED